MQFTPYLAAISAANSSSVETTISSNCSEAFAAMMTQEMMGCPQKSLVFLRGMRFEPARAGMMQIAITMLF